MNYRSIFCNFLAVCATTSAFALSPVVAYDQRTESVEEQPVESRITGQENKLLKLRRSKSFKVEILEKRKINESVTQETVKDSQGFVYRRYVRKGDAPRTFNHKPRRSELRAAGSQHTFYESFEDYQESFGYNWIPPTWTEQNTPENIPTEADLKRYFNNTWLCYMSGGMYLPTTPSGNNEAFCHFGYDQTDADGNVTVPAIAQDEWLISPTITPGATDDLFFDAAVDLMNLYNTIDEFDWNTGVFTKRTRVNDLMVMITTDDGKTWEQVWSAEADVASKMTDKELYSGTFDYKNYFVDMTPYRGKSIKIAFRYWRVKDNRMGNSVCLDGILVGSPLAEAGYTRPEGTLLRGCSQNFIFSNGATMLAPAYTNLKYRNTSNQYSTTYDWTYDNGSETPGSQSGEVLSVNMPFGSYYVPELTVKNKVGVPDTYQWKDNQGFPGVMLAGGNSNVIFNGDDKETVLGSGNYDLNLGISVPQFATGKYCFGTGSKDMWGYEVDAIGNLFEKPASKYVFSTLNVHIGVLEAAPETEFTLELYKIDEWGYLEYSPFITTTASIANIITDSEGYHTLPFTFTGIDEFGLEYPMDLVVDYGFLAVVSGFRNPGVTKFSPYLQYDNHPDGLNFAYIYFWEPEYQGRSYEYPASELLANFNSSIMMDMDALFNYMVTDNNKFEVAPEGGTVTKEVNTYYNPSNDGWWVKDEEIAPFADWLSVSFADGSAGVNPTLSVTAKALPAGTTSRSATFTVYTRGAEKVFEVTQGQSGVEAVESANGVNVSTQGEEFVVSNAANFSKVEVYNIDGKLIGNAEVVDGSARIDASGLSNGMYLLKFDNRTVSKVIK